MVGDETTRSFATKAAATADNSVGLCHNDHYGNAKIVHGDVDGDNCGHVTVECATVAANHDGVSHSHSDGHHSHRRAMAVTCTCSSFASFSM